MNHVQRWFLPVLLGVVVAVIGIGVADVAGLTRHDPLQAPGPVRKPSQRQVEPAQVELDEQARTPTPTPTPAVDAPRSPHPQPRADEEPGEERKKAKKKRKKHRIRVIATPPPAPEPQPAAVVTPAPPEPVPALAAPTPPLPPPPAPPPPPPPPATLPAQVLDLTGWKLTLPVGRKRQPLEIRQPQLGTFQDPGHFHLDAVSTGVVFRAHAGGVTTENSGYPRSELREMAGAEEAAWSSRAGTHVMTITEAITATPAAKPHVVAGQIHDGNDDVVALRLEGPRLFVDANGKDVGVLEANYQLGSKFTVSIAAAPTGIQVTYNGSPAVHLPKVGKRWYFKAGCYTQSNPDQGDSPEAYGEVVIYSLAVQHS